MSHPERLSVRHALQPDTGPYEGIPDHLVYPLHDWLVGMLANQVGKNRQALQELAIRVRMPLLPSAEISQLVSHITRACLKDHVLFLDVIDETLRVIDNPGYAVHLRRWLEVGGSVWTVADDGRSLQTRVDETAAASYTAATTPADKASDQLRQAWAAAYGRQPDPSDAWDHAIKAVEELLIPIVVPNNKKATLANVLGELGWNPTSYTFTLHTSHTTMSGLETLVAMLRLMWPNPDRHGGSGPGRDPSTSEAEAVVQLAITIVQWARAGVIARK